MIVGSNVNLSGLNLAGGFSNANLTGVKLNNTIIGH